MSDGEFETSLDVTGLNAVEDVLQAFDMEKMLEVWANTVGEELATVTSNYAPQDYRDSNGGALAKAIDYKAILGAADATVEIGVHGTGDGYNSGSTIQNPSIYAAFVVMGTEPKTAKQHTYMHWIDDIGETFVENAAGQAANDFHKRALEIMRADILETTALLLGNQFKPNIPKYGSY